MKMCKIRMRENKAFQEPGDLGVDGGDDGDEQRAGDLRTMVLMREFAVKCGMAEGCEKCGMRGG